MSLGHGAQILLRARGRTGEYIDGLAVLRCDAGEIVLRASTCDRVTVCERYPGSRSTDDGGTTWWAWSGVLRDGQRGVARAEDGRTRAIACSGGRLDLL
jgi:hypothetical protein